MKTSQLSQKSRTIITTADSSSLETTQRISTPPLSQCLLDKERFAGTFNNWNNVSITQVTKKHNDVQNDSGSEHVLKQLCFSLGVI